MRKVLLWMITPLLLSACSQHKVQDLYGAWQIDKITLDAMDRTKGGKYELPWGSGLEIKADGSFRTNFSVESAGRWKISPEQDQLFLLFPDAEKIGFRITMYQQQLVLSSLRWQIFLSRTASLAAPASKKVNLANRLPGTWYFYEMNTRDSTLQYPRSKKFAHWLEIGLGGVYRSGEGKHESFKGYWALQKDTLTLDEQMRDWKEQWKVRLEDDKLYFEPLHSLKDQWYQVSLVHESELDQ